MEDIWYLVGIQSDVTDLVDSDGQAAVRERHACELQSVANNLRQELHREFAARPLGYGTFSPIFPLFGFKRVLFRNLLRKSLKKRHPRLSLP